jgi:DNA-binding NtrC family response regulator
MNVACVLLVEDDEDVRVLAEGIIQQLGHDTLTAGDVTEAVALLDVIRGINLLFTDIRLADDPHGGINVAKHARTKNPEIAVIYTTGSGVNDGTRALFVHHHWFLPKPYRPADLETVLAKALSGEGPEKAD